MPPPSSATRLANPALFICDIQDKFRSAIHEFPRVVSTASKMLQAASLLHLPVYVTTQNQAKLGATVPELTSLTDALDSGVVVHADKTAFSMCVPAVLAGLAAQERQQQRKVDVIIVGIETHICVTQTTLDLLAAGHQVYVLQDGVSSCNAGERGVALSRLRAEGAVVTTSEGVLFEIVRDAGSEAFRGLTRLVKETKEATRGSVAALCGAEGEGQGGGDGSKL